MKFSCPLYSFSAEHYDWGVLSKYNSQSQFCFFTRFFFIHRRENLVSFAFSEMCSRACNVTWWHSYKSGWCQYSHRIEENTFIFIREINLIRNYIFFLCVLFLCYMKHISIVIFVSAFFFHSHMPKQTIYCLGLLSYFYVAYAWSDDGIFFCFGDFW